MLKITAKEKNDVCRVKLSDSRLKGHTLHELISATKRLVREINKETTISYKMIVGLITDDLEGGDNND